MKILKYIGLGTTIVLIVIVGLEITYRYQLIDFYSNEYNQLNRSIPDEYDKTVLIFGDSFTAQSEGYVDLFRKELSKYRFINAALPNQGIEQINFLGKKRIEKLKPDVIVLQINPFNEFRYLERSIDNKSLNLSIRNLFKVLDYYNYSSNQPSISSSFVDTITTKSHFDGSRYDSAISNFVSQNPHFINNAAHLNDSGFHNLFREYDKQLENFIQGVDSNTLIYLLVIPHCSQVGDKYYDVYAQLGAELPEKSIHYTADYEFCKQLFFLQNRHKNVKMVNMITFLQNYQMDSMDVYNENDPHLNEMGNKAVYDILGYVFAYHEAFKN